MYPWRIFVGPSSRRKELCVTYRDELEAARSRAEALEAELADLRRNTRDATDDARRIATLEAALAEARASVESSSAPSRRAARPARKDAIFFVGLLASWAGGFALLWVSDYAPPIEKMLRLFGGWALIMGGTGWLLSRREP